MIRAIQVSALLCVAALLSACQVHYRDLMRTSLDLPPNTDTAALPASFEDGWIIVDALVNGRGPYRFMVDTGAPFGLVTTQAAESIGLRVSTKAKATDIVGVTQTYPAAFSKTVQVGPLTVEKLPFLISDTLDAFYEDLDVVGILGIHAFDDYTIDLDYPNAAMRLSTAPLDPESRGLTELRLPKEGSPKVSIELLHEDGTTDTAWFTIDSGSGSSLHLLPEISPLWTHADVALQLTPSSGLSGTSKFFPTAPIAGRLRVTGPNGPEIHSVIAETEAAHSIIGHELLRLFRVRLDRRSSLATFTPADLSATRVASPQYGGIGLGGLVRFKDFYGILTLNPESPAYRAGLRPGDAILAVGGVPVPDLPPDFRFLTPDPPPELTITVGRDGKLVFDLTIPTEPLFPADLDRLRNRPPDLQAPTIPFTTNPDGTFNLIFPDDSDGITPPTAPTSDPANP